MEEPGGLPSMGLQRVRHDWSDLAAAAAATAQEQREWKEKIEETLERKNQLDCEPVGGREVCDGEIAKMTLSFADWVAE